MPPKSLIRPLAALLVTASGAWADEGMWLFNDFPSQRLEERYGVALPRGWLEEVQRSSLRFNNGGSGSFVSPEGLVLTNHHVGLDCIEKLSTAGEDYVAAGFTAASREEELPCPDLELNQLVSIDEVTTRVQAEVAEGMTAAEAAQARRAAMARIEEECQEASGLRCDVVTLYEGGRYDLYRYRRFIDVRLAFAPEAQLAAFGGDADNFEYPRFCLDAALFRVYEDGEPVRPEHHLRTDPGGPRPGEVVFMAGNPGSSGRLTSMPELRWLRDTLYPFHLNRLNHLRDVLLSFGERGDEAARVAHGDLQGVENSIKAISGYLSGLLDQELLAAKAEADAALRQRVRQDPALAGFEDPWAEIEGALETYRTVFQRHQAIERVASRELGWIARHIVRLTEERQKPSGERLRRYRETALPSLLQGLYSEAPIHPDYETVRLGHQLRLFQSHFGPTHPLVVETIGERTPEEVAREAVAGTELADVAARRRLVEGGPDAVASSSDPLIRLMRALEPEARALLKLVEDEVDAVEESAGSRIAEAHFAVGGRETYPDGTFTPRLSFGQVRTHREGDLALPWHTTFAGLFQRAAKFEERPPYELPPALAAARERIDLSTPLNFLSTNDIIGGNSGSPVINPRGRLVGVVFDGNLHMLPNRFVYSDRRARAISVDVRAILEALREIYSADDLAAELTAGGR